MILDGISVEIIGMDNAPFAEYKDPMELRDTPKLSQFGFRLSMSPHSKYYQDGYVGIYFHPDSSTCFDRCYLLSRHTPLFIATASRGVREGYSTWGYWGSYQRPRFKPLEIVENDFKGNGILSTVSSGCIRFSIFEIVLERRSLFRLYSPTPEVSVSGKPKVEIGDKMKEKDVKGLDLSHTVEMIPTSTADEDDDEEEDHYDEQYYEWDRLRDANYRVCRKTSYSNPHHVFKFHYRTRAALISRRLITPLPSELKVPKHKEIKQEDAQKMKDDSAALLKANREILKLREQLSQLKRKRGDDDAVASGASKVQSAEQLEKAGDDDDGIQIFVPPRKRIVVD